MIQYVLLLVFSIVLVAKDIAIQNSFIGEKAPKEVKISAISTDQANRLFKKFASQKDIPYRYPIDGCYARAHQMAKIAETEKIIMGKVFAEGFLQVKTELPKYPIVQWGWHVAPVAYIKNSNKTELHVFDPSLFNYPVTVDIWTKKMLDKSNNFNSKIDRVYFGNRHQYFPEYKEGYKSRWNKNDWLDTKDILKAYHPLQDSSRISNSSSNPVNLYNSNNPSYKSTFEPVVK